MDFTSNFFLVSTFTRDSHINSDGRLRLLNARSRQKTAKPAERLLAADHSFKQMPSQETLCSHQLHPLNSHQHGKGKKGYA